MSATGMQRAIMTDSVRNLCLLPLVVAFAILPSFTPRSQSFKTLWSQLNGDLLSGVVLVSNTLYGTCHEGGFWGHGTVYAVNTDGTGFRIISSFSEYEGEPRGTFVISGNALYTIGDLG